MRSPKTQPPPAVPVKAPFSGKIVPKGRTFANRVEANSATQQGLERVQQNVEGGKVIQTAILQAHSQQVEAKQLESNPMSQFMALQSENFQSPELEVHRSYLVMMTMMQINFSRSGMIQTAVSNLAKARHDTQKNAIANLR